MQFISIIYYQQLNLNTRCCCTIVEYTGHFSNMKRTSDASYFSRQIFLPEISNVRTMGKHLRRERTAVTEIRRIVEHSCENSEVVVHWVLLVYSEQILLLSQQRNHNDILFCFSFQLFPACKIIFSCLYNSAGQSGSLYLLGQRNTCTLLLTGPSVHWGGDLSHSKFSS